MALIWMVEHGCFNASDLGKHYDAYTKAKSKEK